MHVDYESWYWRFIEGMQNVFEFLECILQRDVQAFCHQSFIFIFALCHIHLVLFCYVLGVILECLAYVAFDDLQEESCIRCLIVSRILKVI